MRISRFQANFIRGVFFTATLAVGLLCAGVSSAQTAQPTTGSSGSSSSGSSDGSALALSQSQAATKQDSKTSDDPSTTRLKIVVLNYDGKPAPNASVYIRFSADGGFLRKDKQAEMAFKTNEDGSVKAPSVPVGKVLIQVVGKGLHTYGKWYDIVKDQDAIEIKLEKPPHWY